MPESLQQKVDRMTPGMEVTVTFGGRSHPCTVTGETWIVNEFLYVGDDAVRCEGIMNRKITAIDMPDPEPPYSEGDAVLIGTGTRAGHTATVTGRMVWCDDHEAWEVEVRFGSVLDKYVPDRLTLVPPEPAPFQPGDIVRYARGMKGHERSFLDARREVVECRPNEAGGGGWRVDYTYVDEALDRTMSWAAGASGWDWADTLERVPEPAEPDYPAILVTYTGGDERIRERMSWGFGGQEWDHWLTDPDVATVQALRPAEYLRGGA